MSRESLFPDGRPGRRQFRQAGNRVIYLGEFNHQQEVYCQEQLENAADLIIWLTKDGEQIKPQREQDFSVTGSDVIKTLEQYAQGKLLDTHSQPKTGMISLNDVDRIIIISDTHLLRQFQAFNKTSLKEHFVKSPKIVASVYGNMQCMLKGVCAQCLQWQIDPETGLRTKAVFACSWQDQPLEIIDIDHMEARQAQNKLQEQLSQLWVDYLFKHYNVDRV